jgi:hypothetical protein
MSQMGQTETSVRIRVRSVLPPTTDIRRLRRHVRKVLTVLQDWPLELAIAASLKSLGTYLSRWRGDMLYWRRHLYYV